jgi:hypothetical protein
MNFKQIARVELECVQYSEGDYILCMKKAFGASEDIVKKEKEDDAVTPTGSIESKKIVDNGLITSQSSFKILSKQFQHLIEKLY